MAAYNGAKYISAQLESIAQQSHQNWSLWVSDDGSSDHTCDIVTTFAHEHPEGQVTLFKGSSAHPIKNFMSLLCNADIPTGIVAFSDQDDVWLPDKIERGLLALAAHDDVPSLYGTRTIIVDDDLRQTGHSPLFQRPPHFANAIVQSIAGGNTMMLNTAAHQLLKSTGPDIDIVTHDWWVYQIVSAAGGTVIYDPKPSLLYRQHGRNLIGANTGVRAQLLRWRAVMNNRFSEWNDRNIAALMRCHDHIIPPNRQLISAFKNIRRHRGSTAVRMLRKSGIYRQTTSGNRSLELAAFLGKL